MPRRTLANAILNRNTSQMVQLLQMGADPNETDEYGYTPLIEAAIINDIDIARRLLDFDLDINQEDLTGGTALHWTTENNNIEFTELLLNRGADPNKHTRAGQSPLVKPLLRDVTDLKQLLYRHGARLPFAKDFINTKLLGHRFELMGKVDIVNAEQHFTEVDLEGFFLEFSVALITHSLIEFRNNYAARNLREQFAWVQQLIDTLNVAAELVRYQHYQVDLSQYQQHIDFLLRDDPLILPINYAGHAIAYIRQNDLLAVCDRRQQHGFTDTLPIYRMRHPERLDNQLIKTLLYDKKSEELIENELPRYLGLEPVAHVLMRRQITGNCSWANIEASIPMALTLMTQHFSKPMTIINHQHPALDIYHHWHRWDKARALQFCLESFYEADEKRKASKAALLGALLFQRLSVERTEDLPWAEKILRALRTPGYEYILDSYIETYWNYKRTKAGENLRRLMTIFE